MKRFAALFLILLAAPLAAEPRVSVQSDAQPREVYIGDPISFGIAATMSPDVSFEPLKISTMVGPFDVVAFSSPTVALGKDGSTTATYRIVLMAFSTGQLTVPSLPLQFAMKNGSSAAAKTEEIAINVKSLLAEKGDEGNLRPLKGLFNFRSYFWLWLIIGLILAAVVGTSIYKWWMGRTGEGTAPKAPARPPEEIAWEAIHALEDADLITTGQTKEFYYRLSIILREYMERRYGFSAIERTTAELLTEFRQQGFSSEITSPIRIFFDNADLVKFAKFTPQETEVDEDLNRVKQFVNATTPKAPPPAVDEVKEDISV